MVSRTNKELHALMDGKFSNEKSDYLRRIIMDNPLLSDKYCKILKNREIDIKFIVNIERYLEGSLSKEESVNFREEAMSKFSKFNNYLTNFQVDKFLKENMCIEDVLTTQEIGKLKQGRIKKLGEIKNGTRKN